jgi:hypothetical protein
LPLAKLSGIVKKCAGIVATDMCLPEATRKVFENFTFSLQETNVLWEKLRPLVYEFNGDAEKFYSRFYGLLAENTLALKFDITFTNIIMSEVANHIIIHLSNINMDTTNQPAKIVTSVTDKEMKCLQYISGYIVHKLHNKFRFNKISHVNLIDSVFLSCKHVKMIQILPKLWLMLVIVVVYGGSTNTYKIFL